MMNTSDAGTFAFSCSGNASQSCTCTLSASGTVTVTGNYATAGNDLSLAPGGGTAGTSIPYCVAGSTLQIGPPQLGDGGLDSTDHLILSNQ